MPIVNFYNYSGGMIGCDFHEYIAAPATPIPLHPHVVAAPFSWTSLTPHKRVDNVTTDALVVLHGGYDLYLVPHIFVPTPPPDPSEGVVFAAVMTLSGSKCQMSVHGVTGGGDALSTCIAAMGGINVNCNDPFDMPTGIVLNLSTVRTMPTAGDFAGAFAGYVVDAGLNWGLGKGLKKASKATELIVKHAARRAPDWLKKLTPLLDPAGLVQSQVQEQVDAAVSGPKKK